MNTPCKPLWPKIVATVAVMLPLLYVAGFGPACWLVWRSDGHAEWLVPAFRPVVQMADMCKMGAALEWYGNRWDSAGCFLLTIECRFNPDQ